MSFETTKRDIIQTWDVHWCTSQIISSWNRTSSLSLQNMVMEQILKTVTMLPTSASLSLLIFHSNIWNLKNYSNPILGSQSMGQGFFSKQGFVSCLLFFCPPSPTPCLVIPEVRKQNNRPKDWRLEAGEAPTSVWSKSWEKGKSSSSSLSCYSSLLLLPHSSTEMNQEKHLISASLFAWMTRNSQCNTNELGLSLGSIKLSGGHGQQCELTPLL